MWVDNLLQWHTSVKMSTKKDVKHYALQLIVSSLIDSKPPNELWARSTKGKKNQYFFFLEKKALYCIYFHVLVYKYLSCVLMWTTWAESSCKFPQT